MYSKKLFSVIYLSLIISSFTYSQSISEDNVPLNVIGMHYSQFSNAKATTWQNAYAGDEKCLEATFVFEKIKYIVKYNNTGKKLEEQSILDEDSLYPSIFTELELKHGKFKVISLTKNTYYDKGKVVREFYTLSLKTKSSQIDEYLNKEMGLTTQQENLFASTNR